MAKDISGARIVHDLWKWIIVYMSSKGCEELALHLEEVTSLSIGIIMNVGV